MMDMKPMSMSSPSLSVRLFIAAAAFILCCLPSFAEDVAKYASWGIDEYEFFGLTKQQVVQKFKNKVTFRENYQRICIAPQPGSCAGYDGPTFQVTYENGKVAKVQRIFMGCKETQYGPVFSDKNAAMRYFISSMKEFAKTGPLRPDEQVKFKATQAALSGANGKTVTAKQ
jgi:hypothetical protein